MTHTFLVTAEVRLSFTFRSDDVVWLDSRSPSLRSEAAASLASELEQLIGRKFAVKDVHIDNEAAVLLGTET